MIDQQESQGTPKSPKRKSVWPIVLLSFALLVAGAGILALVDQGEPAPEAAATTIAQVAEEVSTNTTSAAPVVQTPSFLASDEPIADAAEVILPSVVQIRTESGVGSGVIFESNGLILTAAHVVEGQESVTVRFASGEAVEGAVVGGGDNFDVAVVRVDRSGLPAAPLALDGDPRVGQLAIAVGSPWDLAGTVTAGIISAVNQSIGSESGVRSVLQTDAAINPGNSGGPLVDRYGRVLGINVSIFSLSGANDGVGFAIPIDVAYDVANAVLAGESLDFAFLGVMGEDAATGPAGAVITEVFEGTAAAEAGIEVDDLVISLDGVPVKGIADLAAQVKSHRPGTTLDLVLVRDGEEVTVQVTLGETPPESGP